MLVVKRHARQHTVLQTRSYNASKRVDSADMASLAWRSKALNWLRDRLDGPAEARTDLFMEQGAAPSTCFPLLSRPMSSSLQRGARRLQGGESTFACAWRLPVGPPKHFVDAVTLIGAYGEKHVHVCAEVHKGLEPGFLALGAKLPWLGQRIKDGAEGIDGPILHLAEHVGRVPLSQDLHHLVVETKLERTLH